MNTIAPARQRRVFGYSRVSTKRQAEEGLSLDQQEEAIEAYFNYKLKPAGYVWAAQFRDPATSGGDPLLSRKSGGELSRLLENGDAFVAAKLDRAFRDTRDALETIDLWQKRGVSIHLLDISIDTSTDIGRFILTVMAAFATMERCRISQRIAEAMAHRRSKGLVTGPPPYGFRAVRRGDKKVVVSDERERAVMKLIVDYKAAGHSYDNIFVEFLKRKIRRRDGKEYSRSSLHAMFEAEMRLRQEEKPS